MKKHDIISSLFWIGFGIIFCVGAVQNGIMLSPGVPGPGCLAFIVGCILIGLSLLVLIPALSKSKDAPGAGERIFPQPESFRKLSIALIALLSYGFVLEPLGFFLTTLLFLFFVLRFIEPQRWTTVFGFSFLTTFLAYVLFLALKVELPRGIFGI
jgi:putative tricarboxylic transport membrane protein